MTFRTEFADLTGWPSNPGGLGISPAGWAYTAGNGVATSYISRLVVADETYCECRVYNDQISGNWAMMKCYSNGGAMYDNAATNGVGIYTSNSPYVAAYVPGTVTWSLGAVGGWAGTWTPPVGASSAATALVLGIERITTSIFDFYVGTLRIGRATTNQVINGSSHILGGYNGAGSHFDYFYAGPHDFYVNAGGQSAMVLG